MERRGSDEKSWPLWKDSRYREMAVCRGSTVLMVSSACPF